MRDLVVVDYGAGNLRSVSKALASLGYAPWITSDPADVLDARALVLPGVGAAGQIMRALQRLELDDAVRTYVASGRPFLGVCMGMQVLMDRSAEDGGQQCLGVLRGTVEHLRSGQPFRAHPHTGGESLKIPHMGWNAVRQERGHPLWAGIPDQSYFYFVHSYVVVPADASVVVGTTDYGITFPSAVARDNVFGTQFHPEKSGRTGLRVYHNFVEWARGSAAPPAAVSTGR